MGTDAAWRKWGEIDPYYAVLSDDRFRSDKLAESRNEFFNTGRNYVAERVTAFAKRYGQNLSRRRALDFGCGVGRVALALAPSFDEVVGLDISEAMLEHARGNVREAAVANVSFDLSDALLSRATGVFDLVHTYIVLQHIPTRRGMRMIGVLADRVAPGGIISLHFPISHAGSFLSAAIDQAKRHIVGVNGVANLARQRAWGEPMIQMNTYDLSRVVAVLEGRGFGPSTMRTEHHGRYLTLVLDAQKQR